MKASATAMSKYTQESIQPSESIAMDEAKSLTTKFLESRGSSPDKASKTQIARSPCKNSFKAAEYRREKERKARQDLARAKAARSPVGSQMQYGRP